MKYIILFISLFIGVYVYTQPKGLTPPADLKAIHVLDQPNVTLSWWEPGTPYWLHYDSGEFASSVGFNEAAVFEAAIKYESEQLTPFNGMEISQITFVPVESDATYSLRIWIGESGDSLIYEQEIASPSISQWNTIDLDTALVLDAKQTWYFGFFIDTEGGYPIGCDRGPASAPGKCDLIRTDSTGFFSLYDYGLDLNFSIQVHLLPTTKNKSDYKLITKVTEYNAHILAVNEKKMSNPIKISTNSKAGTADSYNIYRNEELIANTTLNSYNDSLEIGGIYNYQVSALYDSQESVKSNMVEVLYDNNRILPNTIIAEAMINIGGGSAGSPGAYKGMFELDYEFEKIAPIIYHNATEILGPDPFSNLDSEERFMEYFLATGAYPLALFQGMALAGGGSSESLYEYYRGAYESVLDIKTPLSFDMNIEKVSATKFKVNIESKVVGIYKDLGLKLHVVLTESDIEYSWNNGEFDKVNFVARKMFPDYNGTMLNFVGDSVAKASIEIEVDPFVNKENYKVVAFIQHPTYYAILNGDIMPLPQVKNVEFIVYNEDSLPVQDALIEVNNTSKTTDEEGKALFAIMDDLGELNYTISQSSYIMHQGVFSIDTTERIEIKLLSNVIISKNNHEELEIYPNPAQNKIMINTNQTSELFIFDIRGREMLHAQIRKGKNSIDVSSFIRGVYFVKSSSNTQKLIVK